MPKVTLSLQTGRKHLKKFYSLRILRQTLENSSDASGLELFKMDEQLYEEIVSFYTNGRYPERLQGTMKNDPTLNPARASFRRQCRKYELSDGKLYFKKGNMKLLLIRASEREDIFRKFHDSPRGHRGERTTYQRIVKKCYWWGVVNYVKDKIKQCEVCQSRDKPFPKLNHNDQSQRKSITPVKQEKINSSATMGSCKRLDALNSHLSPSTSEEAIALENVQTAAAKPGSPLTTHVLDTARGAPAADLKIEVFYNKAFQWKRISEGVTNSDGRCPGLLNAEQFIPGIYKIYFDTGAYFTANNIKGFYPLVEIVFEIEDPKQHYHVPLLLSPFSYSTYRGS